MSIFNDIEPFTTNAPSACSEHGPKCIGHAIRRPEPTCGLCKASDKYPTGYGCEVCS